MRRQKWLRQKRLFEEPAAAPPVQLSPQTQERLREVLFQWFQALAKANQRRRHDE